MSFKSNRTKKVEVIVVKSIAEYGIELFADPDLEADILEHELIPIEITSEWLVKLGFINSRSREEYSVFEIKIGDDIFAVWHVWNNDAFYAIRFKNCDVIIVEYVHQLQNLYYILTGSELVVKEE